MKIEELKCPKNSSESKRFGISRNLDTKKTEKSINSTESETQTTLSSAFKNLENVKNVKIDPSL